MGDVVKLRDGPGLDVQGLAAIALAAAVWAGGACLAAEIDDLRQCVRAASEAPDQVIDACTRLLQQCAQALAAIHRADPAGVGLDESDQLVEWRDRLDEMGDTTATFEWAFRWLDRHRPPPSPHVLVHGDFRMGNLIVDESGLAAVLDWELVHTGEVYEDLAWFCIRAWRFGAP